MTASEYTSARMSHAPPSARSGAVYGRRMGARSRFAEPWSEQRPLDTPDGIADATIAVAALEAAATNVRKRYGTLGVPWGDVYRLRQDSLDLPGNGRFSAMQSPASSATRRRPASI